MTPAGSLMADTHFDSASAHLTVNQLVQLIHAAAAGQIAPQAFVDSFREVHEAVEAVGRVHYASKEQARLIWDVLWELEYYSPDPAGQERPEEWNSIEAVMKTVKRVAGKLAELST